MRFSPLKYSRQHPKQIEASDSDKAIRILFWGNRVGKTEWGAQETARYLLGEHPSRKIIGPIEIWAACPSYDLQKDTTQKKLLKYIPAHRIKDKTWAKKGTLSEIVIDTGDKINFKSYEQGREKFQGAGKRLIWFDEEPPRDIWEECFVRSEAGIQLDIILTMTPVNGMTWVYDELYLAPTSDMFVSEAEWDDNPFLTVKQKEQMMRGLRPESVEVRRKGKFMKTVGVVCGWFDRSVHVKELEFNSEWDTTRSALDFGFSNPACWGLYGVDYDDNIYLFDGFYERQLTTPKIVEKMVLTLKRYGIDPANHTVIADSAQAQSIQEANDYSAEKNYGISFIGVKKETGTNSQNWDEYRADKMHQYGQVVDEVSKFYVAASLSTYDEKAGMNINWFVKEATNLKWLEVASPSGEKQQGAVWDPRYANHAIDMYTYFLVDHLESPAVPDPAKPWKGKVPGTFIRPSPVQDEDDNNQVMFEENESIEFMNEVI